MGAKRFKVDVEGWEEEKREGGDNLSRINPIPLGGGSIVLDIRIIPDHRYQYFNI